MELLISVFESTPEQQAHNLTNMISPANDYDLQHATANYSQPAKKKAI